MNFRNISAWSIRNPVVPIIIFIGLVLVGIVSFMQMKIQDMPDVQKRFAEDGADIVKMTPAQFGAYMDAELAKWGRVVKESNIKAE